MVLYQPWKKQEKSYSNFFSTECQLRNFAAIWVKQNNNMIIQERSCHSESLPEIYDGLEGWKLGGISRPVEELNCEFYFYIK